MIAAAPKPKSRTTARDIPLMTNDRKRAAFILCSVVALSAIGCGPSYYDLHNATVRGDVKRVEQILDADPELINKADEFGATSLHVAAQIVRPELVQLLIDRGANVNAESRLDGLP